MSETRDEMLEAIYAEGDPIIWLRADRYLNARRAKQVAWSGEGIPYGFREEYALLKDLKVSRVFMLLECEKNGFDEWWTEIPADRKCERDEIIREFFRVESA